MRNLLDIVKLLCYDQLPYAKKNCKKCVYRMMNNCGECIFTTNYHCDLRMSKKTLFAETELFNIIVSNFGANKSVRC